MSWMGWTTIGILVFNIVFFGGLAIIAYIEERRRK